MCIYWLFSKWITKKEKKWAKSKYSFTSVEWMQSQMNAKITNHRDNSTVFCFQYKVADVTFDWLWIDFKSEILLKAVLTTSFLRVDFLKCRCIFEKWVNIYFEWLINLQFLTTVIKIKISSQHNWHASRFKWQFIVLDCLSFLTWFQLNLVSASRQERVQIETVWSISINIESSDAGNSFSRLHDQMKSSIARLTARSKEIAVWPNL